MSSALTFTNRRQIWLNQHPLRKQRSFIDGSTGTASFLSRYSDRVFNLNACKANRSFSGSTARPLRGYTNYQRLGASAATVKRDTVTWSTQRTLDGEASELSGYSSGKIPSRSAKKPPAERSNKPATKADDKININIFLSNKIRSTESDAINSDIESSTEIDIGAKETNLNPKLIKQPPAGKPQQLKTAINPKPPSAASRRAQFQTSKENSTTIGPPSAVGTNLPLSASPSLTIQRRPPLVRAMSAPVRPLDENSKNIFANKRKSRRRKIVGRTGTCDKSEDSSVDKDVIITNENSCERSSDDKGNKNSPPLVRGRSTLGCDVVTLVSLLSSEGSDSEKEELSTAAVRSAEDSPVKRAPFLRKSGKSVSFQEHDQCNFQSAFKDFPHMLRRGSIAPLAARLRANRPPTAPPVSIYRTDFGQSDINMAEKSKGTCKDDLALTKTGGSECKENSRSNEDNNFPEYLRTKKERECWRLFQKMSKKGVTVSYDTVLRGMLTPTEFRNMQKQREIEEAKLLEVEQQKDE